jgi:hypothetical protein
MDGERDSTRFELGMRSAEIAVRLAAVVAVGRGSATVDLEDIDWGIRLARVSFEAMCGGWAKYKREYLEFPKFCEQVYQLILNVGGWMKTSDLNRAMRNNMFRGFELAAAIKQLISEARIKVDWRGDGSRGSKAHGYMILEG